MDVLTLGEKKYVKASVIARDLGYTADYVGQLCRGGKVDAKLFGRSWYVNKDSIGDHKNTRYRSTQAKSVQAVRIHLEEAIKTETPKRELGRSLFYTHSQLKASPRYIGDEAPLIPSGTKKGSLTVELADAASVKIASSDDKYSFNAPKLPVVKFKGSLSLHEFTEPEAEVPEGTTLFHPKEVKKLTSEKKTHNLAISTKHSKDSKKVEEANALEVTEIDTPTSAVLVYEEAKEQSSSYSWSIFASTVISCAIVIVLLGLEVHLSITSQQLTTRYVFGIEHLTATVYNAL